MFARRDRWVAGIAGLAMTAALIACAPIAPVAEASAAQAPAPLAQAAEAAEEQPATSSVVSESPANNGTEFEQVLYMREEEKLARDVYLALYEQWGLPVFERIAGSESQHMDAMLALIEKYGLDDPAAGKGAGEFTNPELQGLYTDLVALGGKSQTDALKVGATIEDLDIADLKNALENTTSDDIRFAFENLMGGSENHLRAFMRNLARTGDTYEPQYLDREAFDAIVEGEQGRMGSWSRGTGPGGRGRGMRWQ